MDPFKTVDEIERLIYQKTELRAGYNPTNAILLMAICETDFDLTVQLASSRLYDLADAGFEEIWLADFMPVREGAHREPRLYGLYPEEYRIVTERSIYDQKPYG